MTLLFNSTKILDQNSCMGCIQTCTEPEDYENWPSYIKKCSKCSCPLFPLIGDNKNNCDCPICNPKSEFTDKIYRIPLPKSPSSILEQTSRNHFFFIFDIAMPPKILFTYLSAFHDSITDSDTVSIICLTNNIIFATVINRLLVFDVYDDESSVRSVDNYIIHKKDIIDIVLPSISSIYNLVPAEIEPVSNPFFAIKCVLRSISTKSDFDYDPSILQKAKFSCLMFFYRSICNLQVSEAEMLGESIQESNLTVHFGGPPEFRRLSAISHYSFGCIFEATSQTTSNMNKTSQFNESGINDAIFDKFKGSECQPSIIKHVVKLSRSTNRVKLIAPRSIAFTKTTGCTGSVNTKEDTVTLDLNSMVGGSVKIEIDAGSDDVVRLLEIVKTRPMFNSFKGENSDSNIHDGFAFLTLHTFRKSEGESNRSITSTVLLKGFASDVLRAVWDGDDFKRVVKANLTAEIQEAISNTCLSTLIEKEEQEALKRLNDLTPLFSNASLMQTNVLRLYYVLINFGKCNLTTQLIERDECHIIVAPPVAYIHKKNNDVVINIEEILPSIIWPFSTKEVNDDEFRKLLLFYKVGA